MTRIVKTRQKTNVMPNISLGVFALLTSVGGTDHGGAD